MEQEFLYHRPELCRNMLEHPSISSMVDWCGMLAGEGTGKAASEAV